jgi:signal transduction histidine kinase
VVLLQDLVDRAALALEAARRFEQSLAAIRARDDVLGAVSHDLKTPLTAILGNAQMLRQLVRVTQPNPERVARCVDRILTSSRRMGDMMDELVDTARLEAGQVLVLHRVSMDITALARAIVADQQITTTTHTLRLSGVGELCGIWDAARLRRVLENLIGNAIKYSPDGGDVRVEIGREDADSTTGACAVIRVVDKGIGIPAADLPHLFERFRRGQNVTQIAGTGLGLSGAKQIIEQHGGSLDVSSVEGLGSAFTIRLPLTGPTST